MMSVVWVVQGALTFSVAACLEVVLVCVFGPERCGPATAWLAPLRLAFCGSVQDARPQDAASIQSCRGRWLGCKEVHSPVKTDALVVDDACVLVFMSDVSH